MLPLGTANNIAKSVGVVGHARDVIAGWASGRRRPFDLGSVEAPRGSTRFVESFGGGLFADLLARAEGIGSSALHLGRETDSALYLLEQLAAQAEAKAWRVSVDGIDHGGRYLAVEVMNVQFIGANVPLAPHADVGDGELDVVLLGEKDREALRTYLHDRLELASGTLPAFSTVRGRSVELTAPAEVRLRLDDEPWPSPEPLRAPASVTITVEAGAAEVLDHR